MDETDLEPELEPFGEDGGLFFGLRDPPLCLLESFEEDEDDELPGVEGPGC